MIARTAVAQDDISGDGTTSTVLVIGELMKQSERFISEGMHPRVLVDGFDIAKKATLEFLESFKTPVAIGNAPDKEILKMVARTTLRTKVHEVLADQLTNIIVDAVLCIRKLEEALDLFMVEIMHMRHKFDTDTCLVEGLVLDHGARHPDMKKRAENCYILTCNVSLEYEKSEINAGFFYHDAEQREKMVAAERRQVDEKVKKIIALKKKVCDETDKNFVVINQKGIDPTSLDMFAKEGGAGAFEVAARQHLMNNVKKTVQGRAQLGVEAFADALLVIPKTLAENSGLDTQDVLIALQCEHDNGNIVGLNVNTGDPMDPQIEGIFDNYSVKRQIINSA